MYKKKYIIWPLVFLLFFFNFRLAAADPAYKPIELFQISSAKNTGAVADSGLETQDYWSWYPSDAGRLLSSPAHWNLINWIRALAVVGIGAGFYLHDQQIQNWAQKNKSATTNGISKYTTPFGDPAYILPALGITYAATGNEKVRKTVMLSIESLFFSNVFVGTLKLATHRHRPYTGAPYNTFDGPGLSFNDADLSFPSDHAATAFSIASVVSSEYGDTPYVSPIVYTLAALTAYSRINDNKHWASDVFVGGMIGYGVGKSLVFFHSGGGKQMSVLPIINGQTKGLSVGYKF